MKFRNKFIENYRILNKDKKSIVVNLNNKNWIKINRKYLEQFLEELREKREYPFISEESCEGFDKNEKRIFEALKAIHIIVEEKYSEKEELNIISFSITNKCNLNCPHCCSASSNRENDNLSLNEIKYIIDKIVEIKPKSIDITGGEPLCRKDFKEILLNLKEKFNGKIELSTNATLINEKNVKNICSNIDYINISLDGYDEQTVKLLRTSSAYMSVVRSIKLLKENGFQNISLSMLLYDETYQKKERFLELCETFNVKPLMRIFSPLGRGWDMRDKVKNSLRSNIKEINKKPYCNECRPGKRELSIDEIGNVYPCQLLHEKEFLLGNIFTNENLLKDIINNLEEFEAFKNLEKIRVENTEKCENCNVNIFCGSCRATHKAFKKDVELFDKYCSEYKNILNEKLWKVHSL